MYPLPLCRSHAQFGQLGRVDLLMEIVIPRIPPVIPCCGSVNIVAVCLFSPIRHGIGMTDVSWRTERYSANEEGSSCDRGETTYLNYLQNGSSSDNWCGYIFGN